LRKLRRNFFRGGGWSETSDDRTASINEKLFEVPPNVIAALLFAKPSEQRRRVVTIDLDLGEHREGHPIFGGRKFENLGVGAGLLSAELVAREREDLKALCGVFVMKRTQTCVLRREASSTRNVDDQANLIDVRVKRDRFARDRFHAEVGKSRHPLTVVHHRPNNTLLLRAYPG
jgi:hypothetical protein